MINYSHSFDQRASRVAARSTMKSRATLGQLATLDEELATLDLLDLLSSLDLSADRPGCIICDRTLGTVETTLDLSGRCFECSADDLRGLARLNWADVIPTP